ncbi:alpha/beta hydrolase [Nocardia sp. CA2R105]|uniref:alpha/beta fold hydrolase n=1 Tax=Nocardia coffeae TaxID=2873381 RepID=UPI001CA66DF7|nr:alpha/beta hydrolase [Nocardia coffeae]MBY8864016.1 alpha/beta hydrolase [Nocardia coffeae]
MFADFDHFDVATSGSMIHGVQAGNGPAVLLLHGIPQTHAMWRLVAPVLARDFTVVATDLRGYGDSSPDAAGDHSMRALAQEQREAMELLGHRRFAVVGHDRGARCAYRMALDYPETVTALSMLDIVPTSEAFAYANAEFALGFWVWSFMAAPEPVPETLITAAPDFFVDHMLDGWAGPDHVFEGEVRSIYRQQFRDPQRVATICAQYRAAATVDRVHDETDQLNRRMIHAPTQVLWSSRGAVNDWYDPLEVWQRWATNVRGGPVDCGHFIAEEQPDLTAQLVSKFLTLQAGSRPTRRACS